MNVKIYNPSKNVMQSGRGKMQNWILEYETKTPRTPEPLMGWTASGDTLNQVQMRFDSAQQAVDFAKGKGWAYTVMPERTRIVKPRNYADNFKYIPPEKA
jgi:hypothetical protein